MNKTLTRLCQWHQAGEKVAAWLNPLVLLLLRLYLFRVFFLSGLTKLRDWDTTLLLFREEYHVPLLPPELAAVMGTFGELVMPVLLLLGVFGRFAAASLFMVNLMAFVAYRHVLLLPNAHAAALDHLEWGLLILVLVAQGSGRWSLWRSKVSTPA